LQNGKIIANDLSGIGVVPNQKINFTR